MRKVFHSRMLRACKGKTGRDIGKVGLLTTNLLPEDVD